MIDGKYTVELITGDGVGGDLREILYRHDNLALARAIYKGCIARYSGRMIALYDRTRVLARSDQANASFEPTKSGMDGGVADEHA
jgi:hypothetical protein